MRSWSAIKTLVELYRSNNRIKTYSKKIYYGIYNEWIFNGFLAFREQIPSIDGEYSVKQS